LQSVEHNVGISLRRLWNLWSVDRGILSSSYTLPKSGEFHEAASRWGEAARTDVERFQIVAEADMEELATSGTCAVSCCVDQRYADSSAARCSNDHDVFDERVNESVPQHVHEANEPVAVACDDPAEAVTLALSDPVPFAFVVQSGLEGFGVHGVNLIVRKRAPPRQGDLDVRHLGDGSER
jgi:hypothetical protein